MVKDLVEDLDILEWLRSMDIDIAFIDGTFWDHSEISHRDVAEILIPL